MKYIKIIMMLCVAALFTACSDDDESWGNAANATVEFEQAEIIVKENKGIVNIPVKVTGENKGRVQVTVAVAAADENGAEEDVNYLITSKTIVIAADDNVGNIEFLTVDDEEINANREFIVTIASVKGATVVEGTQTKVVLRDNDAEFYDKLTGKWTMNYTDAQSGAQGSWTINVIGADDENDPDYNNYLYVTGMAGYSWTVATLTYKVDMETGKVTVTFEFPQSFADEVNFGIPGYDYNNVALYSYTDVWDVEPVVGEVSEDFKTITFSEGNPPVIAAITDPNNGERTGYYWWFNYIDSMTR